MFKADRCQREKAVSTGQGDWCNADARAEITQKPGINREVKCTVNRHWDGEAVSLEQPEQTVCRRSTPTQKGIRNMMLNQMTMNVKLRRIDVCDLLIACTNAAQNGGEKWQKLHDTLKEQLEAFDEKAAKDER